MVFQVNKKGVRQTVEALRVQGHSDAEIAAIAGQAREHHPEVAAAMFEVLEEAQCSALQSTDG